MLQSTERQSSSAVCHTTQHTLTCRALPAPMHPYGRQLPGGPLLLPPPQLDLAAFRPASAAAPTPKGPNHRYHRRPPVMLPTTPPNITPRNLMMIGPRPSLRRCRPPCPWVATACRHVNGRARVACQWWRRAGTVAPSQPLPPLAWARADASGRGFQAPASAPVLPIPGARPGTCSAACCPSSHPHLGPGPRDPT